ncbi:MAG: glycosyltransferase family 2 protein [Candidatus Omnitrophica bacterium]|nr:glycosyltransferase family 2 protein [Candidatus Omnitrophota bacterium]
MKVSIIVPVYNEKNTVEDVISKIENVDLGLEREIIIVDDGSRDGTKDIITKINSSLPIKKVFHSTNQGKGAAIAQALKCASGDIIIIQDGDLEYDPAEYPKLLHYILNGQAEAVYGSRFLNGNNHFLIRNYLGNLLINAIARLIYARPITDIMTGHKVFLASALQGMDIKSKRFGFDPEITGLLYRSNYRIIEVPISYACRNCRKGKKIGFLDIFDVLWWMIFTNFRQKDDPKQRWLNITRAKKELNWQSRLN